MDGGHSTITAAAFFKKDTVVGLDLRRREPERELTTEEFLRKGSWHIIQPFFENTLLHTQVVRCALIMPPCQHQLLLER